jgi:hypothetical protein
MRKALIMIFTFLGGIYFFCEFFFPREWGLSDFLPFTGKFANIVGAMAVGVGIINIFNYHCSNIIKARKGWHNSLALLIALVTMFTYKILISYYPNSIPIKKIHDFLFYYIYVPLDTTTFSLLAFYMASAAYRSFRLRSFEASLMMAVSLIVMLGQIPLGQELTRGLASTEPTLNAFLTSLRFEDLKAWIMDVWNVGAQRGIILAMMAGGIAFELRLWLSLEKGSFFEQQ